ncbi:FixH family protein [Ornithinibacillus xuwenensis]|uniref:FixH family protein n=1 Tax=Ornithinibacillus xuwenensis TaxID=3144668 RepID=A0ABU9XGU3_9BACI
MKKRHLLLLIVSIGILLLAACGKEETGENKDEESVPEMIEVEILTNPEMNQLQPNETITISAKVTQGGEAVNDANEVRFEFWKDGQASEEHEMINGEFQSDGIYAIEKMVQEPGTYYVIAHVTAREMHKMPKQELVIGEIEHSTDKEQDEHEHDSGEESNHDHHASSDLMLHIMVDSTVDKDQEIALVGHIQQEEQPVSEADVDFEIWKAGTEKHEYVEATEEVQGEYTANYTFVEAGEYTIKLHFKKDDLHDHQETTITVQ